MQRSNGQHLYTQEEDAWVKENLDLYSWPELTNLFNRKFGTNLKSISDHYLKTLGWGKAYNRGNCPKGTRRNTNTLPVGAEGTFNGSLYVKIGNEVNDCSQWNGRMPNKHGDPNWKRKDYIVWESAGNTIPKDSSEMLVHLNMDKKDCRLENLYLISRKVNFMMAKNGWYSENGALTLAGIKWCELFYAIQEARG